MDCTAIWMIVLGAVVSTLPNIIYKLIDNSNKVREENRNLKLTHYVELIHLFTIVLKNPSQEGIESLIAKINIVNMIESREVVESLALYHNTWGQDNNQLEQNKNYTNLLVAMRKDLKIEGKFCGKISTQGLVDLNIR